MGSLSLLQRIFLTQESNWGLQLALPQYKMFLVLKTVIIIKKKSQGKTSHAWAPSLKALGPTNRPPSRDPLDSIFWDCLPVCYSSFLQYFSYHFFCKHQMWLGQHCTNILSISRRGHTASFYCQEKLMLSQQLNQCLGVTEYYHKLKVLVTQSCPALCNPMDYSPPASMEFSRQEWSG